MVIVFVPTNNYLPWIIYISIRGHRVSHDNLRNSFSVSICLCSLISGDIISDSARKQWNHVIIYTHQVGPFLFLILFYILLVHGTVCVYFYLLRHVCVFFLLISLVYIWYIWDVECSCMCKWIYLVFSSVVVGVVCYFGYFSRWASVLYKYCSLNYFHHKYNTKLYNCVKEME